MQFPESWLREFCDPPIGSAQLAEALTMAGLEVEERRPVAPLFSGVVVAEIVSAEPHPAADRLRVCRVNAGVHSQSGSLQIVCGAPNARAGLRAPLALVGAQLPPAADGKPFVIGASKLRGVESAGMLCSARELQLSDDHGGLLELDANAPIGSDIRQALNLDDTLFTLKLTPNLAHCLSVYGIAREVSALTGAPLKMPRIDAVPPIHRARLPVAVEAPDLCGRFSGRIVRNVNTRAQTPRWMVERLARCGQRSVNALVDISNFVMFEYGRPSHIFDLDKIHERLVVRWGRAGESLKLLNGNTVNVDDKVGVIADAQSVESLAGIMGGDATAVSDDTRHIYVEAAFWWPQAIAGRSRRYGFATDAGHRFERGVDPATTVEHIERITRLILDICGGEAGPIDDQQPNMPRTSEVSLRVQRASKVIGMPVSQQQCEQVFTRLGLPYRAEPGRLSVRPPSWRFDLQIEEDLIEEVARIIGFQTLPDTAPLGPIRARPQPEGRRGVHALRHRVADLGYQETVNFSFVEEAWERDLAGNADPIKVLNPIAAHLSVMRSSLIGSLVGTLKFNLARRAERVRLFEIGRVYRRDASVIASASSVAGVAQPQVLAGLAYGAADGLQWGAADRAVDFFDVKGDLESLLAPATSSFVPTAHPALHPGRSASVLLGGQSIGVAGELHPRWCQAMELPHAPIVFEVDLRALLARGVPVFNTLPKQQSVWRDLSIVLSESVPYEALVAALSADSRGLIRSAQLFDLYRLQTSGKGREGVADSVPEERSLAVRLELRDDEAALTDERVQSCLDEALARVARRFGARLRS